MDDVERYDCGKDKVCRIPSLNEPRMYLSTCAMGSSIYAICGFNKDEQGESRFLNTFERLDNPGAEEGTEEHEDLEWVTLALAEEINLLTERASTIAVAINTQEIAIFGGYKGPQWYGDLYLFNTETGNLKKAV